MFSSFWWLFLFLVLAAGLLFKIPVLAGAAIVLLLISALAVWWRKRSLEGLIYRRRLVYRRGYPGEEIPMLVEAENQKLLPLSWVQVDDPLPLAIAPRAEEQLHPSHVADMGVLVNYFSLRWYERKRYRYSLLLRKRGVYPIGPARLESGDLFGFFDTQAVEEFNVDYITVFPEPLAIQALQFSSDDPLGERKAKRRLYEDPNLVMGVRDYQPTDDFRRVHWPSTAHTGKLQVKVYQPVSTRVMVACLNASTVANYWEGMVPDLLEHILRVTAAVVQQGLADGYQVGLVSNGCLAHADRPFRVPPGRSAGQLAHLLTALAGVTMFVSGPFDRFLRSEAMRLPYGAHLVVVTGILYPALNETIIRMKNRGWRLTLISFDPQPLKQIPGVHCVHLPYTR